MATLYVRDLPDDVYEQLRRRAAGEGRSISQETIRLLRLVLATTRPTPDREFEKWLEGVTKQRARWVAAGRRFPDSLGLIREDRQR